MKLLTDKKALVSLLVVSLLLVTRLAFGAEGDGSPDGSIGALADNVTSSFESIGILMIVASYIGGFALTIAAIFKFKQHKDNPTQIPIGTPIALLVIGIILVFLPSLFGAAGTTIFGDEKQVGGFGGEGIEAAIDTDGTTTP